MSADRFIEAVADRQRVCQCICPAAQPPHHDVCALFVNAGDVMVLERMGEHYAARCMPCAKALGYRSRPVGRWAGPVP